MREGLRALAEAVHALGRVVVVAPDRDRSAASHALTLDHPLRAPAGRGSLGRGRHAHRLRHLGVLGLLDARPDIVVSGINAGLNVGDDVTYSGTIAGAIEGTVLGVPSIAHLRRTGPPFDFVAAAALAVRIAALVLDRGLPADTLLSINVPRGPHEGMQADAPGPPRPARADRRARGPGGKTYYWIGGKPSGWREDPTATTRRSKTGYVSITPLSDRSHQPRGASRRLRAPGTWLEMKGRGESRSWRAPS